MTSVVRGNEKSGPVRGDIPGGGKRQRHWHFRDLSPGYRYLSNGLRAELPIEVESASVSSANIPYEAAVMSDLGILGDSERRQRAAQVPDCGGEADDENNGAGQQPSSETQAAAAAKLPT
jgi:hypothetical protein